NTGTTLLLDATTGSWNLSGGTLKGGTYAAADGAALLLPQGASGTLDGVTLASDFTVAPNARLTVLDGLALDANLTVQGGYTFFGGLTLAGTHTVPGSGQIILGGGFGVPQVFLQSSGFTPATVTLASGVTLRGYGRIDDSFFFGGGDRLVNRGVIAADVAGQDLAVNVAFSNAGQLQV